jgi:uncharacterized protein YbaA (DUF1428 family)
MWRASSGSAHDDFGGPAESYLAGTRSREMEMGYVDIYLLPVPEGRLDDYREQATSFGTIVKEYGGLSYREFRADDAAGGFAVNAGLIMTAAVAEFESRAHRDDVMGKVMADPRVVAMTEGEDIADMSAMRYGGFETFVEP